MTETFLQKSIQKYKGINKEFVSIITGVFLLFLAISGNFLAETLGCQTQKLLTNSIAAKQIMIFFIIFFTLDFSNLNIEKPSTKFFKTILVYVFYLLFTKMDRTPTLIVFILLITTYVTNSYKKYYKAKFEIKTTDSIELHKTKLKHKKTSDQLLLLEALLLFIIMIVILVGFFKYYMEHKKEYKKDFNLFKFVFGVIKCKHGN
jgi:Ca2+/Na+ antiporter|tara:strand:+ start:931 stop:1542 length:612 start_codon:yes stop_codon:yes gene_type:complete